MGPVALHLILAIFGQVSSLAQETNVLEQETRRFLETFNLIHQRLAEPFEADSAIYQGALPAMLRTLDPHSAFLDPQQLESLQEMQRSTEKGFGSIVNLLPGRVIVLQTLPGSPSARAGIAPGDEILILNGYPLANLPVEQLLPLLGSARQTQAQLMVKRPNFLKLLKMTLIPAEMADPSVSRQFELEPGFGYIKIINFEADTARELHQAIENMGSDELKGLVLDLRGNPGGIVEVAIQAASFFLEARERILWIQGRSGTKEELLVPAGFEPYHIPLCILIDNRTASAAELFAGALQDHNRAQVLGQRSFGKGLIQSIFELSANTALALTTAYYQTPNERTIQRWPNSCGQFQLAPCREQDEQYDLQGGIVPDLVVRPLQFSELESILLTSNSFLEFARDYIGRNNGIDRSFEPTNSMLDDFQLFLSERRIRPALSEWSSTLEFIRSRLKQEVLNLAVGVETGDEVELRRDPVIKDAVRLLRESAR